MAPVNCARRRKHSRPSLCIPFHPGKCHCYDEQVFLHGLITVTTSATSSPLTAAVKAQFWELAAALSLNSLSPLGACIPVHPLKVAVGAGAVTLPLLVSVVQNAKEPAVAGVKVGIAILVPVAVELFAGFTT